MRTTADCGCTSNTGGCGCGKSGDCGCSKAIKPAQENQPWLREVVASGIRDARLKECLPSSDSRIRQSAALSLDSRLVDRSGENRIKFLVRDAGGWREDFSQSDAPELPAQELNGTLGEEERQRLLWAQIQKEQDVRLQLLEIAKRPKESSARSLARTHPAHGIFKWPGLLYNEWGLSSDASETQGCCPRFKVTEIFNAGYSSDTQNEDHANDPGYPRDMSYSSLSEGITLGGMDIYANANAIVKYLTVNGVKIVDLMHLIDEFAWTKAPEELVQKWPGQWAFDDSSCDWLYMSVGQRANDNCNWPSFLQRDFIDPSDTTFLVSALMPYAVFDFRNIRSVEIDGCTQTVVRIRYWIGVTHHFSFFVPLSLADGSWSRKPTYMTDDLPSECWSSGLDAVSDIGIRTDTWMKMGAGCKAGVFKDPKYGSNFFAREYFVNSNDFSDENYFENFTTNNCGAYYFYDGVSNGNATTAPSACCFSNHTAYESDLTEYVPWRAMTSLLGINATGEVCFTLSPWEIEQYLFQIDELVREGFRALFGKNPEVKFENKFWAGPDGSDFYGNHAPHTIVRSFAINERTLIPVSTFCQKINNLRETDEGKWLFRSFDSDRLLWAVQSNAENDVRDDECCT